ncbi:MAG: hypothetical protein LBF34_02105 [Puniceicoccales bacterium]|nr:hypothetical protein [Puniceicoccales bacterium]
MSRTAGRPITLALKATQRDDIVLIAGKGREIDQQIGDEKVPFSERCRCDKKMFTNYRHGVASPAESKTFNLAISSPGGNNPPAKRKQSL